MVDEVSTSTLVMSELPFVQGTAHIDTLNEECLHQFDSDDTLMLINVYRDRADIEQNKVLGRIYRPGHAEYYRACGEITWNYLRKLNEYSAGEDGDGMRIQ